MYHHPAHVTGHLLLLTVYTSRGQHRSTKAANAALFTKLYCCCWEHDYMHVSSIFAVNIINSCSGTDRALTAVQINPISC